MIRALIAIWLLSFASLARAQQPEPIPAPPPPPTAESTLTITTRVVAVDAVVRDKHTAKPVLDLTRDAFTLREDGKPVDIKYFSHDNDLPLTVGLLVDTSGSQREYFDNEAAAADDFLRDTLVQKDDRAFVVKFDAEVLLLQKMTSSLRALHNGLRLLDYSTTAPKNPVGPLSKYRGGGGTLLFDAIDTVSANVMARESGRRALVVLTDGDDNGSRADLSDAVKQAQAANVAVYTVLYTHDVIGGKMMASSVKRSGFDVMTDVAHATGGRVFVVGLGMSEKEIFAAIAEDLRSQYRIGFTPAESKPGQQHKLDLRTADKNLAIQARTGYVTPK